MQSLKSRFIIGLIKNRHLLKFQLKPEVVDETFDVKKFRDDIDKVSLKMKLPESISVEQISVNGMNAEWIQPSAPLSKKVLMYIHGGGFISGSCLTHRAHVAKFAESCQLKTLLFDYRIAPEHPFPAAPIDCLSAYKWLLAQGYQPNDIIVGGESAGATLTLSLLHAINENKLPMPKAAFSISPITDLSCKAASFTYNAPNDIAPMGSWITWTQMYIAGNDTSNPLLSPLFANFTGAPPLFICVGTHEIHLDDCLNIAAVAQKFGVEVTLRKWDRMVHAFPLLTPLFPEARKAFHEICEFIKHHAAQ